MNTALIIFGILTVLFAVAAYLVTRGSHTDGDMWKGITMLFFLACSGVCALTEIILTLVKTLRR